jgi:hypothetical protein
MSKKISELPQYIGAPSPTGDVPISIGGVTYKIDPSLLSVSTPSVITPSVYNLTENDYTNILLVLKSEHKGGFINYLIEDEAGAIRSGIVNFALNNNGQSFRENATQSIKKTSQYTFSLTSDATNIVLRVYNDSSTKATISFFKHIL